MIFGISKGFHLGAITRAGRPISPIPWIMCLIGSGTLLLGGIGSGIYSTYFIVRSVQTEATVINIVERKNEEGHVSHYPVYTYKDLSGSEFTDRSSSSDGRVFNIGDPIPIRYLKNSPHQSRVDYFSHHWVLPIILTTFSVIVAAIGFALRWWRNKEHQWLTSRFVQPATSRCVDEVVP